MFAAAAGSPNLMLQATIFLGAALLFVPLGKRFGIARYSATSLQA